MTGCEQRLMDLLAQGPLTAQEMLEATGWVASTFYGVMAGLRQAGIVTIAHVKLRGRGHGSGRGKAIYQLAPSVPGEPT